MRLLLLKLTATIALAAGVTAQVGGGRWDQNGTTGVPAMHVFLSTPDKIVIIDKVEGSELLIPGTNTQAWGSEFDLKTNTVRAVIIYSDTFCSAGSWLANGTLIETGGDKTGTGDPVEPYGGMSIRYWTPCEDGKCNFIENVNGMELERWYPTAHTLPDGRAIVFGGIAAKGNNPTYEFIPRNPNESRLYQFPFLNETVPIQLYPHVHLLPNGHFFIMANKRSIMFDYVNNKIIIEFPQIDGHPRNYPLTAGSVLLPLSSANNYAPEILVCGGADPIENRDTPADNTCGRIRPLDPNATWAMETMPSARVMGELVLLADGSVVLINGMQQGYAGYSHAKNPNYTPLHYIAENPVGSRWEAWAASTIARDYHSVATLIPNGKIWVAGSNPHSQLSAETEYRVEYFTPPYLLSSHPQPAILSAPSQIGYGQTFTITVNLNNVVPTNLRIALVHIGFVTHSTHMSQRYVILDYHIQSPKKRALPKRATTCDKTYTVKSTSDKCYEIAKENGILSHQLVNWNPQIDSTCQNLYVGEVLCLSPPYTITGTSTSTPTSTSTTTTTTSTSTSTSTSTPSNVVTILVTTPPNAYVMFPSKSHYLYVVNNGVPAANAVQISLQL